MKDLYIDDHGKLSAIGTKTHSQLEDDISSLGKSTTSPISVYDEGTFQGSVSSFNFTGDGVVTTVAGGTATITISGGAGGSALSIGGYENGVFKVAFTTLNVQSPLNSYVSGTSFTITLPSTANITAATFSGDGASLTNLSTSSLANASNVATDTTTLRTRLDNVATDTATILTALNSTAANTTTRFNNVATDTSTLKTRIDNIAVDTTTLRDRANNLDTSTQGLRSNLNAIVSTNIVNATIAIEDVASSVFITSGTSEINSFHLNKPITAGEFGSATISVKINFGSDGRLLSVSSQTISSSGGGSDNLGSHVATQTLNMGSFGIVNSSSIKINSTDIVVSSFSRTSLEGYVIMICTGNVPASNTLTITTTTLDVSAIYYPTCTEFNGLQKAQVQVMVDNVSVPNSFRLWNANPGNASDVICHVPVKPK